MVRFVVIALLLLLLGVGIFSEVAPDLAGQLAVLIGVIMAAAAAVKVLLDLLLHRKQENDEDSAREVVRASEGKVFYDLEKFIEARNRQRRRR